MPLRHAMVAGLLPKLAMSQHGKPCSKQVTRGGKLTLWAAAVVLLHAVTGASTVQVTCRGCH
jgi:hypothetical protein